MKKEAIRIMRHTTKRRLILLVPFLMVFGILYYLYSPQYAFKQFVVALEAHDTKTAKSFCTANFVLLESPAPSDLIDPESLDHLHWMETFLRRLQNPYDIVWKKSDATHADVRYSFGFKGQEGYYHFFLMKTPQGWKIYKWDGGVF